MSKAAYYQSYQKRKDVDFEEPNEKRVKSEDENQTTSQDGEDSSEVLDLNCEQDIQEESSDQDLDDVHVVADIIEKLTERTNKFREQVEFLIGVKGDLENKFKHLLHELAKKEATEENRVKEFQNELLKLNGQVGQINILKKGLESNGFSKSEESKKSNQNPKRTYLQTIPDPLKESEYEWELKARSERKRNIVVRGVRSAGNAAKEEAKHIIQEKMRIPIHARYIRLIAGGVLLELSSFDLKKDIMRNRKMLAGTNIWLEDDYTPREQEVQNWLESVAEEEKRNGLDAKLGYQKIKIHGDWYDWNEKRGELWDSKKQFAIIDQSSKQTR